jgi:all-trans-8'-apo-beta-carotenal 15,15'-oxygenase
MPAAALHEESLMAAVSVSSGNETQVRQQPETSPAAMPANASGFDFAPGIERAFPSRFEEADIVVESTDGQVPPFVQGTYFLNGPARFGADSFSYQHWLDGDGMVSALRFLNNQIRFTSRYVRSTKFVEEQEAGEPLFRTFGTTFQGSRLNSLSNGLESPVNVSVYPFGDHLLAFGEQGLPWDLDPETLETRGPYTFNGRLNQASPFSAHPKFDSESGEMFNFGVFFSSTPRLYFYCFGPEGLRYRKAANLEFPCSVHDFSISKRYAVFYLSPYLLDLTALLHEEHTVMDSLRWQPERGSRLLVLNRQNGEFVASIPVGSRYCLHLTNSFERDGKLFVDVLEFDEPIYPQYQPVPSMFQTAPPGGPVRLIVDLEKEELVSRESIPYLCSPDFPALDSRRAMRDYDDFWMLGISSTGKQGRKFFDQLVHANWNQAAPKDIYQCSEMCYLGGEPVFIGAAAAEEGVVICQEFDARERKSSFLLFASHHVNQGPLAKLRLSRPLYLGFHAVFQPERTQLSG